MEIKVGIQHLNREVVIESTESSADVEQALITALKDNGVLALNGERGRRVVIPAASVSYLEFGEENARKVGFGAV